MPGLRSGRIAEASTLVGVVRIAPNISREVAYWHFADMLQDGSDVCFR